MTDDIEASDADRRWRRLKTKLRLYRIALGVSIAVNVLLVALIALYIHFAGLLGIVTEAVGLFN